MYYLTEMGIHRTPVPKRLLDPQLEEEEPEGIDNEQFLSQLAGTYCNFQYNTGDTLALHITGVVMADKFHELLQFL